MFRITRIVCGVSLVGALLAPLSASAAVLPLGFGGRVMASVPCTNGALYVTVLKTPSAQSLIENPFTLGVVGFYVWYPPPPFIPFTITKLFGPPIKPGQWVLGRELPIGGCIVGVLPVYAPLMILVGTNNPLNVSAFGLPGSTGAIY